jgi:nucleoside-diphosphate-sugar epimerase
VPPEPSESPRPDESTRTNHVDDRPILVTGATGFIGLEVCRQLSMLGVPTRAMVRRRHRAALLSTLDVGLVFADLTSPASLVRAADGCRAVIHLGGRATFEPYERLAPTLVDGTASLVDASERTGVERMVFGSSLFVHGPDDGPVIGHDSPTNPLLDYGRAKIDAESILADSSVSTLAIRLPHVYGWNDLLFGILRSGILPFPADFGATFPHLQVTDAARALIAAVDHPLEGAMAAADDLNVTWEHFFAVVETYLPTASVIPMPSAPVRLLLGLVDRLPLRKPTMLGADTIRGWNLDVETATKTLSALDMVARYPSVDVGIPAVLDAALPYRWRHPVLDRTAA